MVETKEILTEGDLLRIRIGGDRDLQGERIVLHGRTVWGMLGPDGYHRYGVAFLKGQGESYERVRWFREVVHAKAVADTLGLAFVDINPSMVEKRALSYIGRDLSFSVNCIPVKLRGERLMVAMAEPGDSRTLEKLQLFSQCKIVPVVGTPSAIRHTLIHCWGAAYVPSGAERSGSLSFGVKRQDRKPPLVVFVSSTPDFSVKCLAANLAAVLNGHEKRTCLADLNSSSPVLSGNVPDITAENGEWMFLTLPMDTDSSSLDWAVRADEAVLVVSPSHWQQGSLYLEAVFDRFIGIQRRQWESSRGATGRRCVLEFSVVCAQISDIRQGFKAFDQLEKKVHDKLDMREPGVDIRLSYVGGILKDKRNFQKAEEAGLPITRLKPLSPASQCITHIAQSLVRPTSLRDPRFHVRRPLVFRIFG